MALTINPKSQNARKLRQWWIALDMDRRCALDRKREHSELTQPSILPWDGRATNTQLNVPYSSAPADGINSLSSRIMSVVFPLNNQPVFSIDTLRPFNPEGEDDTELQNVMSRFARYTMDVLGPTNLRSAVNLAYTHLITIGDVLIHQLDNFDFRLYRADQYVVRRMHEGDWVDIVINEAVNPEYHPELAKIALTHSKVDDRSIRTPNDPQAEPWETLYTHIHKDPTTGKVTKRQEFRDVSVGEEETFEVSPYMPVRWKALIGEAYGISLIEDNAGDIRTLDALSKALLDGVLLNSEYRWGVDPRGSVILQDMLDSRNGDFVSVIPGEVFPIQMQNAAQVKTTQEAVQAIKSELAAKFLKRQARQAERVTAREIQLLAQELEAALGGILSLAGREVQEPIIRHTLWLMSKKKMIPKEISDEVQKAEGFINLRIKAGLEILNREAEREKLDEAISQMGSLPQPMLEVFEFTEIARDWWQSKGLEDTGRVKTAEAVAQERAQRAQQMAAVAGIQAGAGAAQPTGTQ